MIVRFFEKISEKNFKKINFFPQHHECLYFSSYRLKSTNRIKSGSGLNVIFFAAGAKNIFRSCVPARYHECIS